ncbi:MAG TPA: type I-C CRISPR-associated protein Cas5 [Planctomycetales bacterium]|jgi:CRISPR-associated protein Cas5d|nr:type I-C CRISPR-associated protein Cas5 [Planctomycetales bacterium]
MSVLLPPLSLRVRGAVACFTRPELKAERFSYQVMTPSAARGVLEAVLWKPAIRWRIERIKVLAPIAFISFRRNEVGNIAAAPVRETVLNGGPHDDFFAEDRRQQRNTVALRDVDYVIEARIDMTDKMGPDDNKAKFVEMFRRRVEKGQHFHQPYLGCREFAGEVSPVRDDSPAPISESRELGLMLWDIDYRPAQDKEKANLAWRDGGTIVRGSARPIFFAAQLVNGVLEVPADPEGTLNLPSAAGGGAS